ncbi:hypothetical protein SteCoe_16045 [Stentor coeruleus]|uniref:Potassium channel domain-containing protein n=1 Tax=Stentor coeruleus TaxID=5963 RepID=A0A1R2C262_9CILI|nr:hypothetical protein SteCoe_16045 [Stentor coeruleus]
MDLLFSREDEAEKEIKAINKKIYILDFFIMVLGLLGTGLALYEHELYFDFSTDCIYFIEEVLHFEGNDCLNPEPDKNFHIRSSITVLTVCLLILIFYRYTLILKLEKTKRNLDYLDTLISSKLYIPLLCELIFCAIHVPPRVNYGFEVQQYEGKMVYTINMLIGLIMLGRVYLMWRFFIQSSSWNSYKSDTICKSCNCEGGVNFAVKAELKERPYTIVASTMVISILVFGIALRNVERPFQNVTPTHDWNYMWNGMWCIIITMATVGYGDFYATTHFGRVISVIACFWGTFLISLMVLSLTISSEFTPQESKSFNKIKKDEAEQEVRVKAANAIKFGIRLKIFLRKFPKASDKKRNKVINKFKSALIEFRTYSMKLKASEQDAPIELVLSRLNDKVTYVLDKIKNDCYVYKSINTKLETSENNQKLISNAIDELIKLNDLVINKIKR